MLCKLMTFKIILYPFAYIFYRNTAGGHPSLPPVLSELPLQSGIPSFRACSGLDKGNCQKAISLC